MSKGFKYGITIALLLVLGLSWLFQPEEIATQTWHRADKQTYGGYVLHRYLKDYTGQEAKSMFIPFKEDIDAQYGPDANLIFIGHGLGITEQDWEAIEIKIEEGSTAIMVAYQWPQFLVDYLNLETDRGLIGQTISSVKEFSEADGSIHFTDLQSFPQNTIPYPHKAMPLSFKGEAAGDSSLEAEVLALNEADKPVLQSYTIGEGRLLCATNPLAFSNYYMMKEESRDYPSGVLSNLLKDAPTYHYEFYHLGRMEAQTPMRALLKPISLRGALYILVALGLIYLLFGGKRRQRIIPKRASFENENLDFLNSLSELYHRNAHHRNLLEKRMIYFQDFLQRNYRIRLKGEAQQNFDEVVRKLEPDPELLGRIRKAWIIAYSETEVSATSLLEAEKALQEFYQAHQYGRKH